MSRDGVEYVRGQRLADPNAARVFMLLAELTSPASGRAEDLQFVMGPMPKDAEIPGLAPEWGSTPRSSGACCDC